MLPGQTPDTLQWWMNGEEVWRVKTFALDHDIHIHHLAGNSPEHFIENAKKTYGDLIAATHRLQFDDYLNEAGVERVFLNAGIAPNLEVAKAGFAFWNPDKTRYHTQSQVPAK